MKKESVQIFTCIFWLTLLSIRAQDVEKAFISHELDKDMIETLPPRKLEVYYTNSEELVNLGNELTPKEVKDAPKVTYESDPNAFYTLTMSDVDVPSRNSQNRSEWRHWLIVNIPGSDFSKGETFCEYIGSGPTKDSGLHRYVFLLFKQPKNIDFDEPKHPKTDANREMYSTQKFAEKYSLGGPIAGNFYLAQYDDYVPELYAQLNI